MELHSASTVPYIGDLVRLWNRLWEARSPRIKGERTFQTRSDIATVRMFVIAESLLKEATVIQTLRLLSLAMDGVSGLAYKRNSQRPAGIH